MLLGAAAAAAARMEEKGAITGRRERDQFPVGMRVLAVDDDPVCLKVLETLLRRCQYHGGHSLPSFIHPSIHPQCVITVIYDYLPLIRLSLNYH
jgi:hypothetical protein